MTYPRKNITLPNTGDESSTWREHAKQSISPEFAASRMINACDMDKLDIPSLMNVLQQKATAVNNNDMSEVEAMLMNQALALQTISARMMERAFAEHSVQTTEIAMKLALKAQSQARATLETLSNIKNPPVVYARQANISHGHQQVNNELRTRENKIQQNELLKDSNASVDNRRTITAIATDQELATVETIDRC